MSNYEIISSRLKAFKVGQIVTDQDLEDAGVDLGKSLIMQSIKIADDTKPARKYAKTITDETEI
jgi:hypothetical protein